MRDVNWYYVLTVVVVAFGSIPKGYDEGGFAGAKSLPSFLEEYGLTKKQWHGTSSELASRKANIASFAVLGAAFGSLFALGIIDRLGRLRTWQIFTVLWMSGFIITMFSSGILGLLLFARIWSGLGAGGLTVVATLFLSEIAPAKSRGAIVSVYMVVLLTALTLGFFISYGASKNIAPTPEQYRIVLGIPLIPVGIALILSFFLSDTPRWLVSKSRNEEALEVLAKLRNKPKDHPYIEREMQEICKQVRDKKQMLSETSTWTIVKEIATIKSYRDRFLLGAMFQTIAQWSGGNGITYYISDIFEYAGVSSHNQSLITSGAYGIVKLVFTMIFTWGLIDILGRRFCFISGLGLQCATHIYLAVYMGIWRDGSNQSASDAAIASIFIYAVGWSIGLCTVQYLYGTEILPTRVRGVCYAVNMMIHWFFQFAIVRVTPNMFDSLNIWGAYVFWASICAVGLVILGFWAPETKGVPLEKMGQLFSGPWYMGWKAKVDLDSDEETLHQRETPEPSNHQFKHDD